MRPIVAVLLCGLTSVAVAVIQEIGECINMKDDASVAASSVKPTPARSLRSRSYHVAINELSLGVP